MLGLGFTALYCLTAAESLPGGDAALYSTIYEIGGSGHPPGYPLFSMYLWAMSWLPVESAVYGASLATALVGGLSISVLYLSGRSWGFSRFASGCGALVFGLAGFAWLYHTKPDVLALNHLIAASILWLSGPNGPLTGGTRIAVLGLLAGFGASHHHTVIFLAPLGFTGVWFGWRESDQPWLSLCFGPAGLAVGLLPYTYLYAVSMYGIGWHWGDATTVEGFLHLFFRRDYGTLQLTSEGSTIARTSQIWFLLKTSFWDMFGIGLPVAEIGLLAGWTQSFSTDPEETSDGPAWPRLWATQTFAVLLLSGPVFVALFNVDPREGVKYLYVRKLHLLFELIAAFAAIGGFHWLGHRLPSFRKKYATIGAIAFLGFASSVPVVTGHQNATVERYLDHIYKILPDDAIVFGAQDHDIFGTLYYRRVLGRKPNLTYIQVPMLGTAGYHERVEKQIGFDIELEGDAVNATDLLRKAHETGRPVFMTDPLVSGILERWPSMPWGPVIRILPKGQSPPDLSRVFEMNKALQRHCQIEPPPESPKGSFQRMILEDYASTWYKLAKKLDEQKLNPKEAEISAYIYGPWMFDGHPQIYNEE